MTSFRLLWLTYGPGTSMHSTYILHCYITFGVVSSHRYLAKLQDQSFPTLLLTSSDKLFAKNNSFDSASKWTLLRPALAWYRVWNGMHHNAQYIKLINICVSTYTVFSISIKKKHLARCKVTFLDCKAVKCIRAMFLYRYKLCFFNILKKAIQCCLWLISLVTTRYF